MKDPFTGEEFPSERYSTYHRSLIKDFIGEQWILTCRAEEGLAPPPIMAQPLQEEDEVSEAAMIDETSVVDQTEEEDNRRIKEKEEDQMLAETLLDETETYPEL